MLTRTSQDTSDPPDSPRSAQPSSPLPDSDAQCAACTRPNCSGPSAHRGDGAYLGCRQCGIDLLDIQPLFLQPDTASPSTCEICGLRYRHQVYARLHLLSHFNELSSASAPLFCVQCKDLPASDEADNEQLQLECDLCSEDTDEPTIYATMRSLSEHKQIAHDVWPEERLEEADDLDEDDAASVAVSDVPVAKSEAPQFQCAQCPEHFGTRSKLQYHRRKCHTQVAKSRKPASQTAGDSDSMDSDGNGDADDGDKDADDDKSDGRLQCRICETDEEKIFVNRAQLRAHEDAVHRDAQTARFPCAHCDRDYRCVSFLALHLLKHTKRKRFECDVCGKRFGRLSHMQYHRSTHTELRQFECGRCEGGGKAFKTEASLRRHMVHMHPETEREVRRYPCELCDKVCRDSSDLRRHRWTHGGFERRFGCELCEKRFYEQKALRAHMRTHERKGETGKAGVKVVARRGGEQVERGGKSGVKVEEIEH